MNNKIAPQLIAFKSGTVFVLAGRPGKPSCRLSPKTNRVVFSEKELNTLLIKYLAMRMDYENLSFDILERLYTAKSKELENDLLSGVAWEEMRIKRMQLTELSNAMNRKLQNNHPSEDTPQRNGDMERL